MSRRRNLAVGWTLAALVIALFVNLGLWQSRRAVEKQAMLDASAQVLAERTPHPLSMAADASRARAYDWAGGEGRFDTHGALLLDNQQRHGRAGVRAYRVFVPEGGSPLLVDLGWLPLGGRREFPAVPRPEGRLRLAGLLTPPPSTGLALGPALGPQGADWLLTRIDIAAISAGLGVNPPLAPRVLRLDPALKLGYDRDLELLANTLPPDQHRGYALQWFALALAVFVTAAILTLRKSRR